LTGKNNSKSKRAKKEKSVPKGFQQFGPMIIGFVSTNNFVRRRENYRAMDEVEMATLQTSLEANGFQGLIVACEGTKPGTFEILDGHHRWEAAQALGVPEVPVALLSGDEDAKDLAMLSFNVTGSVKPDIYVDFLAEMSRRVGADILAQYTAVDRDFLADLAEVSSLDSALAKDLGTAEDDKTSDHSRGRALTIILPRSDEVVALLKWACAHYGVKGEGDAVLAALRDCHENLGSADEATFQTRAEPPADEPATSDSAQPERLA
jgi:hypothetical protein